MDKITTANKYANLLLFAYVCSVGSDKPALMYIPPRAFVREREHRDVSEGPNQN